MPAEIEETVSDPNPVDSEQLFPKTHERPLDVVRWRLVLAVEVGTLELDAAFCAFAELARDLFCQIVEIERRHYDSVLRAVVEYAGERFGTLLGLDALVHVPLELLLGGGAVVRDRRTGRVFELHLCARRRRTQIEAGILRHPLDGEVPYLDENLTRRGGDRDIELREIAG